MEMPKKSFFNQRIGEILISQGLITPQQLEEALKTQKEGNKKTVWNDFANALRSILRQDPNIIMVGEI